VTKKVGRNFAPVWTFMSERLFFILLFILMAATILTACKEKDQTAPMSFREIRQHSAAELPRPQFIKASDGVRLACYAIMPAGKPSAALIFIHGGGAYSGAGYQQLAYGLSEKYSTAVYLVDLRGHGNSEGPRGDAPSVEQVWNDLKLIVTTVRENNPGVPLYLGGHSSGGGQILNYLTWDKKADVDGYFFISPQFGYKSDTARSDVKTPFAKSRLWVFVISAISGGRLLGNTEAVYFNYPNAVLKAQPLLLKSITRNMSVAITPDNPQQQFGKIDKRFALFIGAQDDLFVPQKVIAYAGYAAIAIRAQSVHKIIENENHLSILLTADDLIGKTIIAWQMR
jgi:acylglycerol lipase